MWRCVVKYADTSVVERPVASISKVEEWRKSGRERERECRLSARNKRVPGEAL
jgi:hypothetical protein